MINTVDFDNLPEEIKEIVNRVTARPKNNSESLGGFVKRVDRRPQLRDKDWNDLLDKDIEQSRKPRMNDISGREITLSRKTEEEKNEQRLRLLRLYNEVQSDEENVPVVQDIEQKVQVRKEKKNGIWDFGIEDEIPFFDISLSYELSGYRPINDKEGLDFDPSWFIEVRENYKKTGVYTDAPKGTKAYDLFWTREYNRMQHGMESHGYTITGDHYYFLNYYRMLVTANVKIAGQGRTEDFPSFYVAQYEYFHYIDLCKKLKKNAVALKGRALGFSEIAANVVTNTFESRPHTRSLIVANNENYLDRTLAKVWDLINFCNKNTSYGLFKPLGIDLPKKKKTFVEELRTKVEKGWLSEVEGIIADTPNKVRGDRTEIIFFEEAGSFKNLKRAFIQGEALTTISGDKIGISIAFGTGGDSGPNLEGLKDIFYHPEAYLVLPFRSVYNKTGEEMLTGFFIPSYRIVTSLMDNRGYTPIEEGKEFYEKIRANFAHDPQGLIIHCAEYCFVPEEAFVLEGENLFNRTLLVDQLTRIVQFKQGPKIEKGILEYDFQGGYHDESHIKGVKFIPHDNGKLRVLERPLRDEYNHPYLNLYVAGIDAIDMGMDETSEEYKDPSSFCMTIYRRVHGSKPPQIVAIYKDRPNKIRDAFKMALLLCEWYNCKVLLENTKISVRLYFEERKKAVKFLMRRPQATLSTTGSGSRQWGAPATETVIHHQLDLIAAYIEDYSDQIWFEEILDECIHYSYTNKRKFDIIASLGMMFLADEELSGCVAVSKTDGIEQWSDIGYYTDPVTGYKRYGTIPKQREYFKVSFDLDNDYNGLRSSDPRNN